MLNGAVIFLLDVDNTLLDNDRFAADLGDRLESAFGADAARPLLGDFCARGAQRWDSRTTWAACRNFAPAWTMTPKLLGMSQFLLEYPFASRLFPRALEAMAHLCTLGTAGRAVGRRHRVSAAKNSALRHLGGGRRAGS